MHCQGASNLNCITVGLCQMFAAFHDQFPLLTIRIKLRLELKSANFAYKNFGMQNIEMLRFGMQNIQILMSRKLSLLPYLIRCLFFSQGILDYLDNLTVTQIRKLFSMLSTLAFTNHQDGGLIQVICNKNGARGLICCIRGESTHQSFMQRGSAPRSNPLPFYIRSLTERQPFHIPSTGTQYPFHRPGLEQYYIPFSTGCLLWRKIVIKRAV